MKESERRKVVQALLDWSEPLPILRGKLEGFPWSCEEELVQLKECHIAKVLSRYCQGLVAEGQVEEWADLIELRDDIGWGSEVVRKAIFRLATPELEGKLTIPWAKEFVARYGEAR